MGFVPKIYRARRSQSKGKVERLVHYVKDNFLPGRAFSDFENLNLQAMLWCRKADSRIHSTTGLIPLKELKKEPLLSLQELMARDRYRYETRRVSTDGFVSYDGVPWRYSGKELRECVTNGKTTLPIQAWKVEYNKLTAERKTLNQRYVFLKDEVKEAEQIQKSVYNILRQKQRE